ncbi:hypothetical protein [Kangiella spongicola]|uniref:Uncharacterized protein n=1 Tax=Kangiella spongicola TaxID=796379 RepID=A0A318D1A3_9GAMM|nr:hypothetical protein [Kangiella spongicola]PXF62563.1 hypothetical protein DL796_09485 [Kangiella spongicola]
MSTTKDQNALFNLFNLVVILLGAICLFVAQTKMLEGYPTIKIFLNNAGTSGFVAVLLIYTVEKFSRQKQQNAANKLAEELNRDVVQAVYKRHIPKSVMTEVEKCLLQSNISRENYEVIYTIKEMKIGNAFGELDENIITEIAKKYYLCEIILKYSLKNISTTKQKHTVEFNLESPIDPEYKALVKIRKMKIGENQLTEDEIAESSNTEGDDQVSFSREVVLDPGETIVVQGEGSLIKQHLDSELWVCMQPTEGMRLTVSNNIEGLNVYAKANHFQELESVCNDNSTLIWMLPYGIFPYQSVTLWWECDSN